MAKAAPKPRLTAVAPEATDAPDRPAPAPPAHPEHQPRRTGTPTRTHDPGQTRAAAGDAWADLHPQRVWPD